MGKNIAEIGTDGITIFRDAFDELRTDQPNLSAVLVRAYSYFENARKAEGEIAALREKVEAWEWWEEARTYDPWSEHPYCTACGNRSKRGKIFDCAVDEYEKIKSTAREAIQ